MAIRGRGRRQVTSQSLAGFAGLLLSRPCVGVALALALAGWARPLRADLQEDVRRLTRAVNGRAVHRLGPRLLEQGEELPLLLPPRFWSHPGDDCTHVVVMGAQSVHFSCEVAEQAEEVGAPVSSRAGLVEVVRCGEGRQELADLTVTMLSTRGPLEAIAFSAPSPIPIAVHVLPNRFVGLEAPERVLAREAELPRLGAWLNAAEAKAQAQGASRTERRVIRGEDKSLGEALIGLDPGCHELQLIADVDLEAVDGNLARVELIWQSTDDTAAEEQWHTRAPTLRVCTALPNVGQLHFPALPRTATGVLFRAHYQWPAGIPSHWATPARNRVARALWQRQVQMLSSAPVRSWLGGGTAMSLNVPVMPGACYVATLAATAPVAGQLSLEVMSGSRLSSDSSVDDSAASVAFCQEHGDAASIGVDAREANTTWILGLWHVASLPVGAELR